MDPQMTRVQGHHYDQDPLHPVAGEEEHHEKKSVLKKVKAKARKIKDSLTHSHGHGEEEEREQSDEGDELVEEPDVHGAPMYESAAAKNFVSGQEVNSGKSKDNMGLKSGLVDDQDQIVCPGTFQTKITDPPAAPRYDSTPPTNYGTGHDVHSGQGKGTLGERLGKHDSTAPPNFGTGHDIHSGQGKGTLGERLGEDLGAPKHRREDLLPTTHGTKITDPRTAYESATSRKDTTSHDVHSGIGKAAFGERLGEGLSAPKRSHEDLLKKTHQTKITDPGTEDKSAASGHTGMGHDVHPGLGKVTFGEPFGEDTNVPKQGHLGVPPANYQSKVTDPATEGGHEAGATSILHSFNKMNIYDEPQHKEQSTTTRTHDQFSPRETSNISENTQSVPQKFNSTNENHPQDMNVDKPRQTGVGIRNRISPIADRAISAKKVVASKLGYGGTDDNANKGENVASAGVPEAIQQNTYTGKISSATSAIADRAILAKNVVTSKLGYGGTDDNANKGENVASAGVPVATESVGGPEAIQQNTYTGKFSSATSAITDRAISAKNVVASKLGYGGTDSDNSVTAPASEVNKGGENANTAGGGVTGYVTGKLAPVYGTVAGAGSAVVSKLPGMGTQKNTGTKPGGTQANVAEGADTGSVKGYLAEKLKPGEEDKALSEMISGALHKPKTVEQKEVEKRAMSEIISDAVHKRSSSEDRDTGNRPMGKVTESDEVAKRLGSSESEKLGMVAGDESPGKGVVDKFKGAFTNWFGKGGETNPSQAFNDQAPTQGVKDEKSPAQGAENVSYEGERRLQESTN